jgi:aspartate-semialdehyde dehydrogenase
MSRPCAEPLRAGRVAVVGAPAEAGLRLREVLAESGVPGSRVDLYGATSGELALSEYDGEARMIQEPDLDEIAAHPLIFLCTEEGVEIVAPLVATLPPEATVIDLSGAWPDRLRAPLRLDLELEPAGGSPHPACYSVAHPLALLLGELLIPLQRRFGVLEAAAVVLRPASDFGPNGVEELREQTVRLLSFAEFPVETFGRQLAFNLIPQGGLPDPPTGLPQRITRELAELLEWSEPRLALRLVGAPLFYGHAVQLRLRLGHSPGLDRVRATLDEVGLLGTADDRLPTTPMDVVGESRAALTDLSEDGLGGFWAWAVAGEAGTRAARQAVSLAAKLGRL